MHESFSLQHVLCMTGDPLQDVVEEHDLVWDRERDLTWPCHQYGSQVRTMPLNVESTSLCNAITAAENRTMRFFCEVGAAG